MTKYLLYISNEEKFNPDYINSNYFFDTASNINSARKKALIVRKRAEHWHYKTGWTNMYILTENGRYVGLVTVNKSRDHLPIWIPVKGAVAFINEKGRIY